jgi:hypothetical protein
MALKGNARGTGSKTLPADGPGLQRVIWDMNTGQLRQMAILPSQLP